MLNDNTESFTILFGLAIFLASSVVHNDGEADVACAEFLRVRRVQGGSGACIIFHHLFDNVVIALVFQMIRQVLL